jgi:hypothetical protein
MGQSKSKINGNVKTINNNIIRMVTYNINQTKSVCSNKNVNSFIADIIKSLNTDIYHIVAVQGIFDAEILFNIYKQIQESNSNINIAPQYTIHNTEKSTIKMILDNNTISIDTSNCVIITKLNIQSYIMTDITDNTNQAIFGKQYCCAVNLEIYGSIISIYTSSLPDDIFAIKNISVRSNEIDNIMECVSNNVSHIKLALQEMNCVHVLMGCFYIPEIYRGNVNKEYIDFFRKIKGIDIYRLLNGDRVGNTTIYKTRISYLVILINDMFEQVIGTDDIPNKLLELYGLYPLESVVSLNFQYSDHFPIITTFMIRDVKKTTAPLKI